MRTCPVTAENTEDTSYWKNDSSVFKVQRRHFTGEVDKAKYLRRISSWFCVSLPKTIQTGSFLTDLFKKDYGGVFETRCISHYDCCSFWNKLHTNHIPDVDSVVVAAVDVAVLVPGNTPTSTTRDAVMPSSHRLRRNGVTKNAWHCLRCCCVLVVVARPHRMHGVQICGMLLPMLRGLSVFVSLLDVTKKLC